MNIHTLLESIGVFRRSQQQGLEAQQNGVLQSHWTPRWKLYSWPVYIYWLGDY